MINEFLRNWRTWPQSRLHPAVSAGGSQLIKSDTKRRRILITGISQPRSTYIRIPSETYPENTIFVGVWLHTFDLTISQVRTEFKKWFAKRNREGFKKLSDELMNDSVLCFVVWFESENELNQLRRWEILILRLGIMVVSTVDWKPVLRKLYEETQADDLVSF